MSTAEVLRMISLGCFGLAAISLVLTVWMFFKLKILDVMAELSGKTRANALKNMHDSYSMTGSMMKQAKVTESGSLTGETTQERRDRFKREHIQPSVKPVQTPVQQPNPAMTGVAETGVMNAGAAPTGYINVAETGVMNAGAAPTGYMNPAAETDVLSSGAAPTGYMNPAQTDIINRPAQTDIINQQRAGCTMRFTKQYVITHTEERIV